jgi:chromosome partitioning protein
MRITLVGGEKGGTGKTTLAVSLAANRARQGRDVALVDTDAQGSAAFWTALRDETNAPRVACVRLEGKAIARQITDLAERYDELVIDAGGRDSVELRAAMTVAQRLLTPIQASQFDTWTIEAMSRLIEQAAGFNPDLDAIVCINRASPNPRVAEAQEAQELVTEYETIRLAETVIRDRIAHRRAVRDGLSAEEAGDDPKAAYELQQLAKEVYT